MKNKTRFRFKVYRKIRDFLFLKLKLEKYIIRLYPSYIHAKQYMKKQEKKEGIVYYTQIPHDGAGIGHKISNTNSGIFYAKMLNVEYVYPGLDDQKWDDFLGFGEGIIKLSELKKKGYKIVRIPFFDEKINLPIIEKIVESYRGEKVILLADVDQFYQRQYDVIPYIKDKFEHASSRKNDSLIYNPDHINIAVHIRRGDIVVGQTTGEATLTKRWLTTEYFENIVKDLSDAYNGEDNRFSNVPKLLDSKKGKAVDFYLFSQGDPSEYKAFEKYGNIHYCFDMPAMESFLHMVRSDILVTSKSSFSYKPALLADGVRICPKHFWHGYPDDEKWIVVDD